MLFQRLANGRIRLGVVVELVLVVALGALAPRRDVTKQLPQALQEIIAAYVNVCFLVAAGRTVRRAPLQMSMVVIWRGTGAPTSTW